MKNAFSSLVVFVGSFCFVQSIIAQRSNAIIERMRSTAPWRINTISRLIAEQSDMSGTCAAYCMRHSSIAVLS